MSKGTFIKQYWNERALKYKKIFESSWEDKYMMDLEIETISKYIYNKTDVLDAGCAKGYSTFKQSRKFLLKSITGIDFSQNMISAALKQQLKNPDLPISFLQGDIRNLPFESNSFDIVYTTRVLINLPDWQNQKKAINECIRVTKKKGTIIFSEAFIEPLNMLNSIRSHANLPELKEHKFNRYLKKKQLESYLDSKNMKFEIDDFSSIYYIGSRFIREILSISGFINPINKTFKELEKKFSGGGFGIQQMYIIKK